MTSWHFIPNISGAKPAAPPPTDRIFVGLNNQNRVGPKVTEHVAFWDGDQFVRLTDDLFREPVFFFFHQWREFGDAPTS